MPRTALSSGEISAFRERICAAAFELFATQGYAAVTMRAIATKIGCSPMTPYRYFVNKSEIFALVSAEAFRRFADAQDQAVRGHTDPAERLCASGVSYVAFALAEPDAYRIMFELDPGPDCDNPELVEQGARAWSVMRTAVGMAVDAGLLVGDPDVLAHQFWASVHGLVSLHISGKLMLGKDIHELFAPMMRTLVVGSSAGPISAETMDHVDAQLAEL
jgi:AcrR family transcriptional regulator